MARRYHALKGKAGTFAAIGALLFVAWSLFGQTVLSFNLNFLHQGFQYAFFRGGFFAKQGINWDEHDHTLGRIVSTGNDFLEIDLAARLTRGTLVIYVWRWPAVLYDEPMVERFRFRYKPRTIFETDEQLRVSLPDAGIYVLTATGLWTTGDIAVDWRVRSADGLSNAAQNGRYE